MKTTKFTPDLFTSTPFDNAEEKAKFANQFAKLVKSNFSIKNFPNWFYQRLSMVRSHIAHYNAHGFFANWFEQPHQKVAFIERWIDHPIYGEPVFCWSDVEKVLSEWLKDENWLAKQKQIMAQELKVIALKNAEPDPLAGLITLDFIVAAKSRNTNSFGLNQYVVVSRNGLAYKVHRTLMFPWIEKQVITVPLRAELRADGQHRMIPAWERLGVEIPEQFTSPPAELLEQIWDSTEKAA